jgi:hypothetical protein
MIRLLKNSSFSFGLPVAGRRYFCFADDTRSQPDCGHYGHLKVIAIFHAEEQI